jgi:hypothetical protein
MSGGAFTIDSSTPAFRIHLNEHPMYVLHKTVIVEGKGLGHDEYNEECSKGTVFGFTMELL